MASSLQFSGLFNLPGIPTPRQETILSHYRDLPTGRQEKVITYTQKKSAMHNLRVLLFTLLGSVTGGVAGATMLSPEVREKMELTPAKTVLLNVLALPAAVYCGVKSFQHRVKDGQLQTATAALALEANKTVSIGGVPLSPEHSEVLLETVGQPVRQEVFSGVRQERAAEAQK